MDAAEYHQPQHWDRTHAAVPPGAGGLAARAVHQSVAAALIERAQPSQVVLDLACGSGSLARLLPPWLARLGADFSGRALERARREPGADTCAWLLADAGRLPLRPGTVNAAGCVAALWTLPDHRRALAELARVMRPGGTLILHLWDQPAACRLITLGAAAIARVLPKMRLPAGVTGPFELAEADVAALAAQAGFDVVARRRHEITVDAGTAGAYWREYSALAPTSYAAYQAASRAERDRADALLGRLLSRAGGPATLAWRLLTARRSFRQAGS